MLKILKTQQQQNLKKTQKQTNIHTIKINRANTSALMTRRQKLYRHHYKYGDPYPVLNNLLS